MTKEKTKKMHPVNRFLQRIILAVIDFVYDFEFHALKVKYFCIIKLKIVVMPVVSILDGVG